MFQLALDVRNARLAMIITALGRAPTIEFWSGTMPQSLDTVPDGTLVASATLPRNAFALDDNGMIVRGAPWQAKGVADGRIAFFRLLNAGVTKVQGDVGTNERLDAAMIVDRIEAKRGDTINVIEFILVEGNA